MIEDDTHDKMIKSVLDYFAIHEEFQQRPSEIKRRKVRKKLQEIKLLCQKRREEIITEHRNHVKINYHQKRPQ
jgi:phosphoenolpyruvate carboxylase